MQQVEHSNYPSNSLGRFWMKIPLIIRAILAGIAVSVLPITIWVLMASNIPIHLSVAAMAGVLLLFWLYFSGKWGPSNTQAFRRFCTRQTKFEKPVWLWGLLAAFLIFVFINAGLIATFRIVEFQPETFKTARYLNDFPVWTAWLVLIMASMVAGICEEVGYRGYLQAPLEKIYGPIASISIASIMFTVVHLHQAWATGILPQIFIISFMIGYLAYSTNSLLFGIIAHVSFDITNYSYWWSDVLGNFERKPISMTGVDQHFILTIGILLLTSVIFIVAIRKLLKHKTMSPLITSGTKA